VPPSSAWLAAVWPLVRSHLPGAPAAVLEIGCGALGGFVPMLESDGYSAVGIDPQAPDGPQYTRAPFEDARIRRRYDAVVACVSLHHVADPAQVVDRIVDVLEGEGTLVVVEWAWEDFDEETARWCFERLDPAGDTWLHARRGEWLASGLGWQDAVRAWAQREGIHRGIELVEQLDRGFERASLGRGAYFFPVLAETSEQDELAAIDAGLIRATRVDYVGAPRAGT
jgi:SAM-dependent methyltransferase